MAQSKIFDLEFAHTINACRTINEKDVSAAINSIAVEFLEKYKGFKISIGQSDAEWRVAVPHNINKLAGYIDEQTNITVEIDYPDSYSDQIETIATDFSKRMREVIHPYLQTDS